MCLKDIQKRINSKINKNYDQRQKILSEVKRALDIEYNKISIYAIEIVVTDLVNASSASIAGDSYSLSSSSSSSSTSFSPSSVMVENNTKYTSPGNEKDENTERSQKPLFRVGLPDSIVGTANFYYKGSEINSLTLKDLHSLKNDLDYIMKGIEKEIDRLLG